MKILGILALTFLAGCSSSGVLPPPGIPVTGAWGGEHIRAALSDSGGEVEYDCAHGKISEPIIPDMSGSFDAKGVHFHEHGGPVRQDEKPDSVIARYSGIIRNNVMKLEVRLPTDTLGPFSLAKGNEGRVFKCL